MRIAAVFLALTLAGPSSATAGGRTTDFVVVSQTAGLLTGHDAGGDLVGSVALDKAPAVPAVTADGTIAYISQPELGTIAVVDLASWKRVGTIETGGQPFGLTVLRDGRLLVVDWSENVLREIGPGGVASRKVAVGHAPSAVVVSAEEKLAFTIDRESDSVSVVDLETFTVETVVGVGRAPFAAALSANGRRLYVANVQSADLSVIDVPFRREIARIPIGGMPYGVAVAPDDGTVAVTDQEGGRLVLIHPSSLALAGVVTVGDYAEGVVALEAQSAFVVANWFADSLSVVPISGGPTRTVPVAPGPRMLAAIPKSPE